MPCLWLSRVFRSPADFRLALLLDAIRWPETAPRTENPLDFATLTRRHS